jgi:hypothetical protein
VSVFTEEPPGDIPTKEDGLITPMANILFTKEGVEKLLKNLDPTKASGPDNISTRILKETATEGSSVKTDWYCLFSAAAFCLGVDSRLSFSFSVGILLVLLLLLLMIPKRSGTNSKMRL